MREQHKGVTINGESDMDAEELNSMMAEMDIDIENSDSERPGLLQKFRNKFWG
jgi:superfamily II DNA or RNA helicase